MSTNSPAVALSEPQVERVALSRLLWAGPLALVASLAVNAVIRMAALALVPSANQFMPLASPAFIAFTIGGVTAAIIVFAMVARTARRPLTVYRRIAVVALLVSFLPDLGLLMGPAGDPPPGTPAGMTMSGDPQTVGALMLMHVATAVITVGVLERLTRKQ